VPFFPYKEEQSDFNNTFRLGSSYLTSKKTALQTRKQFREWFGFSAPRNLHIHDQANLIVPLLANRGLCTLLPKTGGKFCIMASAGFSISVSKEDCPMDFRYVLGLVNSKLLFWRLRQISNKFRGGWITCTKQYFGTLPIRTIDFSDVTDKAKHDRMVELVEEMLSLHKQLAVAKTGHDKTMLQRQIAATDRQIDRLVYKLYDLTDEEIKIVEEGVL